MVDLLSILPKSETYVRRIWITKDIPHFCDSLGKINWVRKSKKEEEKISDLPMFSSTLSTKYLKMKKNNDNKYDTSDNMIYY